MRSLLLLLLLHTAGDDNAKHPAPRVVVARRVNQRRSLTAMQTHCTSIVKLHRSNARTHTNTRFGGVG